MRKLLKMIFILISFVLVVVLALGITLVCLVYDSSDKTPEAIRQNSYSVEYLAEREIFRSVKDVASTGFVDFSLDSNSLNEIVYAIVSELNTNPVTIEGAYCLIDEEGCVTAEIPVSVFGFKSSLKAKVDFDDNEETLSVRIIDAKVGKLSLTYKLFKDILKANFSAEQVEDQLKQIGFETTVDLENLTFTIEKSSILGFVSDWIKTENDSVYAILFNEIFKDEYISYRCGEDQRIGFGVDVSAFAYDPVRDGEILYPIDYESARESTKNYSAFDEENAPALMNYYLLGYNWIQEEYVSVIDSLGMDKEYQGVKNHDELDVSELILEQTAAMDLTQVILDRQMDIYITEDEFDQFFSTSDIIGQSYVRAFEDQVVFISCESVMMNIERNQITLSVIMSLNGKRLISSLTFRSEDNPDSYIEGSLVNVSFGTTEFNPDLYDDLLSCVNELIDLNWLTIYPSERKVLVDLTAIFTENELIAQLISMNFNCYSSFTEDGRLKMTYSL